MATADLLIAVLRYEEVESISIAHDGDEYACSAFPFGETPGWCGYGQTLRQAVERCLSAIQSRGLPISVADAARRATVRLPEGGVATLIRLDTRTSIALVRTPEGRHRRLPARLVALSEVEIQPLTSGERRYGESLEIGPGHPDPPTSVDVS